MNRLFILDCDIKQRKQVFGFLQRFPLCIAQHVTVILKFAICSIYNELISRRMTLRGNIQSRVDSLNKRVVQSERFNQAIGVGISNDDLPSYILISYLPQAASVCIEDWESRVGDFKGEAVCCALASIIQILAYSSQKYIPRDYNLVSNAAKHDLLFLQFAFLITPSLIFKLQVGYVYRDKDSTNRAYSLPPSRPFVSIRHIYAIGSQQERNTFVCDVTCADNKKCHTQPFNSFHLILRAIFAKAITAEPGDQIRTFRREV